MINFSKANFEKFRINLEVDSKERFLLYLFDSYNFLKFSFTFNELNDFYALKEEKYGLEVNIFMEAEIVFGEFFLEDKIYNKLNEEIKFLGDMERRELLSYYIEKMKPFVMKNKFIPNMENFFNFEIKLKEKLNILEQESDCLFKDRLECFLGYNYKYNNYFRGLSHEL